MTTNENNNLPATTSTPKKVNPNGFRFAKSSSDQLKQVSKKEAEAIWDNMSVKLTRQSGR